MRKTIWLIPLLFVAGSISARADTEYDVSGTFFASSGPSDYYMGPLNGRSFSGSFNATLPVTSGSESFPTFDINLFNSSGTLIASLTSASDFGSAAPQSGCVTSPSTTGPCEAFLFADSSGEDVFQLVFPPGSAGGAIDVSSPSGLGALSPSSLSEAPVRAPKA